MKTLRLLYKIGRGPSSSHTMAPELACNLFMQENPSATSYKVELFGSLAHTGKGHGTDKIIEETLNKPVEIVFNYDESVHLLHENTMDIYAFLGEEVVNYWRVLSIGGGAIEVLGRENLEPPEIYHEKNFSEISAYCQSKKIRIPDYVEEIEGKEIWDYLLTVWKQMKDTISNGLATEGTLPGGLNIQRKARFLFRQKHMDETPETKENRMVCAYAYACSEENACGGIIVTAPTCGSCGVLPAVLKYMQDRHNFSDAQIIKALATAGIVGNVVKQNASISGAQCGCQAEIGTACSMASAALAELFDMELEQIEYAAEVAMEHHLGLTCDPVLGLVQIPCIERNAVAAMRAINALSLANFLTYIHKISFDMVVETMFQTGKDLSSIYRETGEGGLAKLYK